MSEFNEYIKSKELSITPDILSADKYSRITGQPKKEPLYNKTDTSIFFTNNNKVDPTKSNFTSSVSFDEFYEQSPNGGYRPKYKTYLKGADNDALQAQRQTSSEKLLNGVAKFVPKTAVNVVGNIVGAPIGIAEIMKTGRLESFYDNSFYDSIDKINKTLDYELPNHYSRAEKEMNLLQKMGTANFYANDLLGGMSFLLGTIGSEVILAAATGGISLFKSIPNAFKHGKSLLSALKGTARKSAIEQTIDTSLDAVGSITRANKLNDVINSGQFLFRSAGYESAIEAHGNLRENMSAYVDWYKSNNNGEVPSSEDYSKQYTKAVAGANSVLALNAALLSATNASFFSNLVPSLKNITDFSLEKAIFGKGIKAVGGGALETTAKKTAGRITYNVLKNPIQEGFIEEGLQGVFSKTSSKWFESQYDPSKTKEYSDLGEIVKESFVEQYTTKEGLFEVGLGSIIGSLGSVVTGQGTAAGRVFKEQAKREQIVKENNEAFEGLQQTFQKQGTRFALANAQKTFSDESVDKQGIEKELDLEVAAFSFLSARDKAGMLDEVQADFDFILDNMNEETLTEEQKSQFKDAMKSEFGNKLENYQKSSKLVSNISTDQDVQDELALSTYLANSFKNHYDSNLGRISEKFGEGAAMMAKVSALDNKANKSFAKYRELTAKRKTLEESIAKKSKLASINKNASQRKRTNTDNATLLVDTNNELLDTQEEISDLQAEYQNTIKEISAIEYAKSFLPNTNDISFSEMSDFLDNVSTIEESLEELRNSDPALYEDMVQDMRRLKEYEAATNTFLKQVELLKSGKINRTQTRQSLKKKYAKDDTKLVKSDTYRILDGILKESSKRDVETELGATENKLEEVKVRTLAEIIEERVKKDEGKSVLEKEIENWISIYKPTNTNYKEIVDKFKSLYNAYKKETDAQKTQEIKNELLDYASDFGFFEGRNIVELIEDEIINETPTTEQVETSVTEQVVNERDANDENLSSNTNVSNVNEVATASTTTYGKDKILNIQSLSKSWFTKRLQGLSFEVSSVKSKEKSIVEEGVIVTPTARVPYKRDTRNRILIEKEVGLALLNELDVSYGEEGKVPTTIHVTLYDKRTKTTLASDFSDSHINKNAAIKLKEGQQLTVRPITAEELDTKDAYNLQRVGSTQSSENSLLVLVDADGNIVGELKGHQQGATNEKQNKHNVLRQAALDASKNNSKFPTVKVTKHFNGMPNKVLNEDNTVKLNIINEEIVQHIKGVAYYQDGKLVLPSNLSAEKVSERYSKSFQKKKTGRIYPMAVINIQGRMYAYPIVMLPTTSLQELYDNFETNVSAQNKPKAFFKSIGIAYDSKIPLKTQLQQTIPLNPKNIKSVQELVANAQIDIDLSTKPFHSPKFAYEVTNITEPTVAPILTEVTTGNLANEKTDTELTKEEEALVEERVEEIKNEALEQQPTLNIQSESDVESTSKAFKDAGEQSKKDNNPKALGNFIIDNAKVGDRIKINEDEYYEVVSRKTNKKGNTEVELQHFVKNEETGEFENNPIAVKLFTDKYRGTDQEKLGYRDASDLFESTYTNSKGERITQQSTYEPAKSESLLSKEKTPTALSDVVDNKTKQQLLDERLNKIKEIKDKAEGTREERTKRYQELVSELGDETAALKKLQEEINNRAKKEIDKLPELPKTENEIINEKGENDFDKIKKDLGFKSNDYSWGKSPMDEDMGDMLLSKDKEAVIFIKPNEVEAYDEVNDQTDTITNGVKIELVYTKENSRGKGKAKELIQKVTDWADKNNTDLHLDIAPQDKSTTESGLKKLYESFGFEFDGIHGIRKPKSESLLSKEQPTTTKSESNPALSDVDFTANGGNTIVNEKGEPINVYHRTDEEFDKFDDTKKGSNTGYDNTIHGFFFADKQENTEQFGKNLIEANIAIKKPIDLRISGIFNNKEQAPIIAEILFDKKLNEQDALDLINEEIGLGELSDMSEELNSKRANDLLKREGYDGIISDMGNNQVEYIVFDKNSIKIKSKNGKAVESLLSKEQAKIEPNVSESNPALRDVESTAKTMDDFDTFKDAVAYNVKRTADIGIDESEANYGAAQNINEIKSDLEKAGIQIEKVSQSSMSDGNYASFDGEKIKVTDENIPLQVLLHEIGEKVVLDLDKAKQKIEHANNIFEAVTTYGASRGNDAFADNFYLYFLSPKTLKELSPNVYTELNKLIPQNIKDLGKSLMSKYGVTEQTLKYNKSKAVESLLSKEQTPTALRDVESTAKALEGKSSEKLIPLFDVLGEVQNSEYNKQLAIDVINIEIDILPDDIINAKDKERKEQLQKRLDYLSDAKNKEKEIENLFKRLEKDSSERLSNSNKKVSKAYHKAKADGSNPELVKAVESLLSKEQTITQSTDAKYDAELKALEQQPTEADLSKSGVADAVSDTELESQIKAVKKDNC